MLAKAELFYIFTDKIDTEFHAKINEVKTPIAALIFSISPASSSQRTDQADFIDVNREDKDINEEPN
jgi:hypothetical protein